ncbi:2-oxoglutarate dehydrogenase complex dihydrolipoyllysine-residue succinyltransferase [soil metagenome]
MTIEVKVPVLPESVANATIATWHKKAGDSVKRDENLVDIETDKVVLEVPAPADGVLAEILQEKGATVSANEVIGIVKAGTAAEAVAVMNGSITKKTDEKTAKTSEEKSKAEPESTSSAADLSPAVRRLVASNNVDISAVRGTGKEGRILQEDVELYLKNKNIPENAAASKEASTPTQITTSTGRVEQRVPMSRLRARIAERLLSAQNEMAILTTFNEINMQAAMDIRKQYKDSFEKRHKVKLGFMSFFVKAVVEALKRFPDVNASIDGNDIIYHGYYDISVAVSTERGLVVPVLRNVENMSMADIEKSVAEYGEKARLNKLSIEDMTGGTFTISNGGVFGSLLSTPILNPPQSAILGMHKIEERPIAENGQVVIRPMMYVALSYDHRIIDGKDSVQFLKTIKEFIEDPSRLLLDV